MVDKVSRTRQISCCFYAGFRVAKSAKLITRAGKSRLIPDQFLQPDPSIFHYVIYKLTGSRLYGNMLQFGIKEEKFILDRRFHQFNDSHRIRMKLDFLSSSVDREN